MYEPRHQPPVSTRAFLVRLANHLGIAVAFVLGSLAIGMAGYAYFENLTWEDAFLHSATLLSGKGHAGMPVATGTKVFAGIYALYSGLVFVVAAGILIAPVVHRLLHKFHWEGSGTDGE
jgi:hypothetical protein